VIDYHQHAIGTGADARAVAYMELRVDDQRTVFGVGIDADTMAASLKAIVSGLQRGRAVSGQGAQSELAPA
jgi:2-isopropylmalate synthase